MNKKKDAFNLNRKLMFTLTTIGVILLIISNQLIFWYLDINNSLAIWVLILLTLSIFGNTAYDVFGLKYFIVRTEDNLVMRNTIMMSITGLLITIPLIYYFKIGRAHV